ncbi:MAG: aldehyde ferredoxin oxidoreductase C-terminal domain-containing protein, partial [Anaerolineae bacterium]|nr:aldehyde ferredoxin oxidoreductase C-terminal domain-containing protein [Anaerolineae bacterium]
CVIQCSNVFVNADGKEITSPVEYETLGLMGTNCGINNVDDLAALNWIANDMGVDTIETGAMIGVLMDAGLAEFGDMAFMKNVLQAIREGTADGRLWSQGTARVAEHYGVKRVPVIKKQAISAYDPRVIEITGVSMMTTAQGADHTAGNVPRAKSAEMDMAEIKQRSLESQIVNAIPDSLGLCIFGRTVTDTNQAFIVETINAAHGTDLKPSFFRQLGIETLLLEDEFNRRAGFGLDDDRLPQFFYDEPLTPSNKVARFQAEDVHDIYAPLNEMKAKLDAES